MTLWRWLALALAFAVMVLGGAWLLGPLHE